MEIRITLTLQYFGHMMWRANSLEKILMLGKIESRRRGWDGWVASPTQWTWEAWHAAVHGVTESDTTEWLNKDNPDTWILKSSKDNESKENYRPNITHQYWCKFLKKLLVTWIFQCIYKKISGSSWVCPGNARLI